MNIVLQDGIKDCGVSCLLSVIRYYGGDVSKELLRELTGTNKAGVSALNLILAAKSLGFNASGVSGDLNNINKNNLPCLAHVIINKSYKHFIVIYDINFEKKKIIVMDPAKGKRKYSFSEFKMISSSNYIFLKPYKKLPIMSNKKIISKIIKEFLVKEKKYLIYIVFLSFVYFIFQIITSFNFKYFIEYTIKYNITNPIYFLTSYIFIIYILKNLSYYFRNILLIKCSNLIDSSITFKTYNHILLLPYFYYKNRTTGEVVSRLKDLNIIKTFLIKLCSFFITDFISMICFFIILFNLNRKISYFILLFILLFSFIQYFLVKFNKKYMKKIIINTDKVNSYLIESLTNIDSLKNNHLEKLFFDRFNIKYSFLLKSNNKLATVLETFSFFKISLNDSLLLLILSLGSYYVIIGKFSLSNLIVFHFIFTYFINCFNNLLQFSMEYSNFLLAYNRIEDLFTINNENFVGNYFYSFLKLDGTIKIKNLSYSINNKEIFRDLNLVIESGEHILLTGSSGCGKSTLMKMLMRYVEVEFGKVSINDIDINHYHLDILRNNIVYVNNLESLFTDTIYNNICLDRTINEEEFNKIVSITKVKDIIRSDLGFQELLEENGANFSNGERQRIILARSLVRKSNIYIFDEVFSQIDSNKTKQILCNIFKYLKGKTIIVISHRFSERKLFDRVLRLEGGKIHELYK